MNFHFPKQEHAFRASFNEGYNYGGSNFTDSTVDPGSVVRFQPPRRSRLQRCQPFRDSRRPTPSRSRSSLNRIAHVFAPDPLRTVGTVCADSGTTHKAD
jgi:hypothetical protein